MREDPISLLATSIDGCCEADPHTLADGETIVALHRQLERLAAVVSRADRALEAGRAWEADGARSAAAWIATRCHAPLGAARRRLRIGRALQTMPMSEDAWLKGEIGEAQVERLVAARRRVTGDQFDADEPMLVKHARGLPHRQFVQVLSYWLQAVDPDGAEDDAEAQREGRRLHLSQTFEGTWLPDGVLDPISGEAVSKVLKRIEDELFEADWAEAKWEMGADVGARDLARTPAQRRADALVEMARRASATPSERGFPNRSLPCWSGTRRSPGECASWPAAP